MIREVAILVIGVLAVSITAKATAIQECKADPPYCEVCLSTWGYLRDFLKDPGFGKSAGEVGKVCTCGYIPDKSSSLYKQCTDHLDQVPGKLAAFVQANLGDPSVHCGFVCGGNTKNASLPACPRTSTSSCNKPDAQLCSVCKASLAWAEELVSNAALTKQTMDYLDVYCNLATTPCDQNACKDLVAALEPVFEVGAYILQNYGIYVCDNLCHAPAENTPDMAQHLSSLLKGVGNFLELKFKK